ncbi:hypothetical protein SAMN05660642_00482 [Geodermatophilus siccatus]|uniref:Uncharacterized protein n=1 Tax=Geodermatophilus siccatus TaxID=1137991 RepID=A0A1G9LLN7_9ACTN|nr:hypothetical protein [Geodermatophilus siccatus]SDL62880.1 hypothetical protein SAMN05660642_00482 [Geodermatophilus siccatus]
MSEREQSPAAGTRGTDDWREQTIPGIQPVAAPIGAGPGYAPGPPPPPPGYAPRPAPEYSTTPVRVRRSDSLASLLLLLAGIAAGVSLLLRWLPGSDLTGWDLVRRGWDDAADGGVAALFGTGFWQPMAVVLGGAVLFLLGLLVVLPAHTHRFLGVLALLVSLVAGAGVLVPLAAEGWDPATIDTGFWFAVAVPVLGLLGALKALFTGPRWR